MSRLQLVMETKGKSPYTPEVNTIDLPDTFETAWAVAEGVVAMDGLTRPSCSWALSTLAGSS